MKKDYWKVVSTEWSKGVFFDNLPDAREFAEAERDCGDTVYTRRVKMEESLFEKIPEL